MTKKQLCEHAKTDWTTFFEDTLPSAELTRCSASPTELAEALGGSLEGLFLFLPKTLLISVASKSNRYQQQYRTQVVEEIMARQRRIKLWRPEYKMKTVQQVQAEQRAFNSIRTHEPIHFIGLLCARTLCPHREKMSKY
ncbi:Heat shock protein70 [Phytophthora megakarya]|uniref:Heat shock protein70 n=1 Tax=Phytophthora megakarya TaxID=4795 RepID=A0A225VE39_9STRA|nr:Heat shock protein70 [Phytophthora megakarya]